MLQLRLHTVCASFGLALIGCGGGGVTRSEVELAVPSWLPADAALDGAADAGGPSPQPAADGGDETGLGDAACHAAQGLEFVLECDSRAPDTQVDAGPDAATDAAAADAAQDAAPDPPLTPDEGFCAERSDECEFGRAETVLGSATCQISGQGLRVSREMCEVCNKQALIIDYAVSVMDCNVCEYVYTEGWSPFFFDGTFDAHACRTRTDDIDLTWTRAHPDCVDVYARVGNGVSNGSGGEGAYGPDRVRVCRCDRTTDTCVACLDGSCDGM